jgi:hypothetical protein
LASAALAASVAACGPLTAKEKRDLVADLVAERYGASAPLQILKLRESRDRRTYCGIAWLQPAEVAAFRLELEAPLPEARVARAIIQPRPGGAPGRDSSRGAVFEDIERLCKAEGLELGTYPSAPGSEQ